jgi:hypothetical protein
MHARGAKIVEAAGGGEGFRRSLLSSFRELGCPAGERPDLFVYIIDPPPCSRADYPALLGAYDSTALGLLKAVASALPRLEGGARRLCFVNKLSSSLNLASSLEGGFERMVSAACNMAVQTLFNRLRPLGYTFRLYGAADLTGDGECGYIAGYCLRDRSLEEESARHSDENRLVMRDKYEREYPF